jgi:5-methylcytosine-specific restriction endonuclease McrA
MDYSLYHPDWKDIIRPAILKRDNYKCSHCGVKHKARVYRNTSKQYVECDDFMEQWALSNGRKVFTLYLQVAHKDHNKSNNEPSNLLTLCPVHHARLDTEHKRFARIMYKQKVLVAKTKTEAKEEFDRGYLLSNLQDSIRRQIGSKISLQDAEVILQGLLSTYDKYKPQ